MPDNNATNVTVGKPKVGGAVYWAPLGSTLPQSASASLDAAFKPLGYVSEDGVTNNNSPESDKVKAWGGDTVLTLQTDRPDTFAMTLLESLNVNVLNVIYGSGNVVESAGAITVKATAEEMVSGAWVIDMVVRGNRAKRIVIPNGTITELGDIAYKDSEATGYAVTITDVPDTNGVYHYEYIAAAPSI